MKFMHKYILMFAMVYVPYTASSQSSFFREYSNLGDDFGRGIVQLEDSGYVVTGSSSSFFSSSNDAFLMRLNKFGDVVWSNSYGGSESDLGQKVMYIPNNGYYLAGYSNSFGNSGFDFYLCRTDINGQLIWEQSYGTDNWDRVNDAVMLSDTSVILVGETIADSLTNTDMLIIRVGQNGDTLWSKTIGGIGEDRANSVGLYQNEILVMGDLFVADSMQTKAYLAKIDAQGNILFEDTIGAGGNFYVNDFIIINDSLQAVGLFKTDLNSGDAALRFTYRLLTNSLGGLNNAYQTGDFQNTCISNYSALSRRYIGYNVASIATVNEEQDFHFGRYTYFLGWNGQVVQIERPGVDSGTEMIPTSDGGAVAVGYTTSGGSGGGNIFVLKIGPGEDYPIIPLEPTFENFVNARIYNLVVSLYTFPKYSWNTIWYC